MSQRQCLLRRNPVHKKMRGTEKVSKKQKKQKLDADGNPIEKKPKKGGRQRDKNMTEIISNPDNCKTIDGETLDARTKCLQ